MRCLNVKVLVAVFMCLLAWQQRCLAQYDLEQETLAAISSDKKGDTSSSEDGATTARSNSQNIYWCLTGNSEPELLTWPFNQFEPLIRRTTGRGQRKKGMYKQRLELKSVTSQDFGMYTKNVHIAYKSSRRQNIYSNVEEIWEDQEVEGVLIQANHDPYGFGLPTGQFSSSLQCSDCNAFWGKSIACGKRASMEALPPTVMSFHYQHPDAHGNKRSEIHANFRFSSPGCSETKRVEFIVMTVRSFQRFDYDVVRFGPYEITQIPPTELSFSDHIPSPPFNHRANIIECHGKSSLDIRAQPGRYSPMHFSSLYIDCLRADISLNEHCEQRSVSNCPNIPSPRCFNEEKSHEHSNSVLEKSCGRCRMHQDERTDYENDEEDDYELEERRIWAALPPIRLQIFSLHGVLMVFGNFWILFVMSAVARFGKETLNKYEFKGYKIWFWVHSLGSIFGLVVIYFGLLSSDYRRPSNSVHEALGYAYGVFLVLAYILCWIHHEQPVVDKVLANVHGVFGYIAILLLAVMCICYAPMRRTPKIVVNCTFLVFVLFFGLMTFHICKMDYDFGMRPRRNHLLILEARFDRVPVPKNWLRLAAFGVFAVVLFILNLVYVFI